MSRDPNPRSSIATRARMVVIVAMPRNSRDENTVKTQEKPPLRARMSGFIGVPGLLCGPLWTPGIAQGTHERGSCPSVSGAAQVFTMARNPLVALGLGVHNEQAPQSPLACPLSDPGGRVVG